MPLSIDRKRKEQAVIANTKFSDHHNLILEKVRESALSVLPILVIVVLLCFSVSPIDTDLFLSFLVGAIFVVVGMGLFSLGAETSMTPIGSKLGTAMTKSRSLPLIIIVSFILGFAVTIAEPDLQVLAQTVPHINNTVLLVTVGVGVGFFLCVCMIRILTGVRLRWLLIAFYAVVFILAAFSKPDFLGIAFDSGGVTTGPMTVPFILALGVGVSKIRSDAKAESDSFGLVALCSIGPILAVLLLGFFYPNGDGVVDISSAAYSSTGEIGRAYLTALPSYMKEMAVALLPIIAIFYIFQIFSLRLSKREVARITIGVAYTYVGLVLFLTGVNVGFSSLGAVLGAKLAEGNMKYLLIPLSMLLGWFIISAEPAVAVLEKQIEEVSAGAIPGKVIKYSLSVAIAAAMGASLPAEYESVDVSSAFRGVYAGQYALPVEPDALRYLTNGTIASLRVYNYETGAEIPVYDLTLAAGRDGYEMFLGGTKALLTIENPNAETDRELVIFRDSFGSSIAPLLAQGYAKVTVVDIRYMAPALAGRFVDLSQADDVLFLYSTGVLNHSETIQ